jgi:hypothetical protein
MGGGAQTHSPNANTNRHHNHIHQPQQPLTSTPVLTPLTWHNLEAQYKWRVNFNESLQRNYCKKMRKCDRRRGSVRMQRAHNNAQYRTQTTHQKTSSSHQCHCQASPVPSTAPSLLTGYRPRLPDLPPFALSPPSSNMSTTD